MPAKAPKKGTSGDTAPKTTATTGPKAEKKSAKKQPEKTAAKTPADKKTADKKTASKKTADKKTADKKTADKKTADKKTADKKTADKKTADKKTADKKTADKKTADKKTVDKKTADKKTTAKSAKVPSTLGKIKIVKDSTKFTSKKSAKSAKTADKKKPAKAGALADKKAKKDVSKTAKTAAKTNETTEKKPQRKSKGPFKSYRQKYPPNPRIRKYPYKYADQVAKAIKIKKTIEKGNRIKVKKVHLTPHFRIAPTLKLKRNPRYPRRSVPGRARFDQYRILKFPLTSESAMKKMEDHNTLVFICDTKARKTQIKEAVKKMYDIKTANINTLIRPDGKKKAFVRLPPEVDALDMANKIGII